MTIETKDNTLIDQRQAKFSVDKERRPYFEQQAGPP